MWRWGEIIPTNGWFQGMTRMCGPLASGPVVFSLFFKQIYRSISRARISLNIFEYYIREGSAKVNFRHMDSAKAKCTPRKFRERDFDREERIEQKLWRFRTCLRWIFGWQRSHGPIGKLGNLLHYLRKKWLQWLAPEAAEFLLQSGVRHFECPPQQGIPALGFHLNLLLLGTILYHFLGVINRSKQTFHRQTKPQTMVSRAPVLRAVPWT
jgi:hypothetical protein